MDWMKGQHLSEFVQTDASQETLNKLGQALWDFYMFQIHTLKKVQADPHPGNFLISEKGDLIALDFGCIKEVPEDFYTPYFELADKKTLNNPKKFEEKLYQLEILREDDSEKDKVFFKSMFHELLSLFSLPMQDETFDFSNPEFFESIAALGEKYSKNTELRKANGNRGSKHFIYINRTFFGLYNLMFDLKAKDILVNSFQKYTV